MGFYARHLNTGFSTFQQVYLRVGVGFLFSLFIFGSGINFKKLIKLPLKEWGILIFRALSYYVLGVGFFTIAINITKYSNVYFIAAMPLIAFFGVLIFKERMTLKKLLFILTAFMGVLLIGVDDFSKIFEWGRGEVLALISEIAFAIAFITRRWQSNILTNKEITQLMLLIAFLLLIGTSFFLGEGLISFEWNLATFLVVMASGLSNTFFVFLSNYGFKHVKALIANNIMMLQAVFALILGFVIYKEIPILKELVGGLIVILSAIAINSLERKKKA